MQKDLISRQMAVETIMGQPPEPHYPSWYATQIEKLPPAQPEREQGHWIISSDGYYPYCSECKSEPKNGEMTDFCPNCGADMRGGERE